MVQRKVPIKIGIKSHLLKLDNQSLNLKPSSSSSSLSLSPPSSSSSQTHDKLKKIMKKYKPTKRPDESRSFPPFKNKKTHPVQDEPGSSPATPQKQSPNYMKSTSSFEARKEQSPKTPVSKESKTNVSRTSSLKKVRTLTKTPSFKPLRSSKKVILCEDVVDAQKATCSSTLKDLKFPNFLQLNPGGTELDGTSAIKVCPYSYCSLNGHHHAPVPPLKCFLSARRRALKTLKMQKGVKLGCLSPEPAVKKIDIEEPEIMASEEEDMKEENRDFFIDIYSKDRGDDDDLECSDVDWEEGYCSGSGSKLQGNDGEDEIAKTTSVETLYDEESVSSGAWSEEDGDSASEGSFDGMKMDQDYVKYDAFEVSLTAESDVSDKSDELEGINHLIGDQDIKYQQKTVPDFAEKSRDEANKNHTTIIYNIIQFNISVFFNGEKTEHTVQVPATYVAADKMETEETMEEHGMSNEHDEASDVDQMVADKKLPINVQDIGPVEQLNAVVKQDDTEENCNEHDASNQSDSMDEEPAVKSDVVETHSADETASETDIKMKSFYKKIVSNDEVPAPCINLRGCRKPREEIGDDSREFNPRGPNFLPETPDPDAEKVDLRHQTMDDRKNAEEWMVDFALQQAVTTLAPERKKKVALLVEAFEKVMPDPVPSRNPIPMYETHNRHASKAFTNSRPMQTCS